MKSAIDILFQYLQSSVYDPDNAKLDIIELPEEFQKFATGLHHYVENVKEASEFARALSRGDLHSKLPHRNNELAAPLKSLHASLLHLTWQAQQIAKGDYEQHVAFMGAFSDAFNTMVEQLSERERLLSNKISQIQDKHAASASKIEELEVHAYKDTMTQLYNRTFGMLTLDSWLQEKRKFALVFADLDNLKFVNDKFGHTEGDLYILNAAKHLNAFSKNSVVSRIGGDEFMVLAHNMGYEEAEIKMNQMYKKFQNDDYLMDKLYTYSISFGITAVENDSNLSASEILSLADERMYENKRMRKRERMQSSD